MSCRLRCALASIDASTSALIVHAIVLAILGFALVVR